MPGIEYQKALELATANNDPNLADLARIRICRADCLLRREAATRHLRHTHNGLIEAFH